ncbi:MAG: hypothetical protein V1921_09145 [Candidatus Altiarchaeota archaeon]
MDKKGQEKTGEPAAEIRRIVEDMVVTPFFSRHSGHMPATIKLHADIGEDSEWVFLKTRIPGYTEDRVEVEATANTINVVLHSGHKGKGADGSKNHGDDVSLNSSYFISTPLDPNKLKVSHKGDLLEIRVKKKK